VREILSLDGVDILVQEVFDVDEAVSEKVVWGNPVNFSPVLCCCGGPQ
jgi:hypothetical protein